MERKVLQAWTLRKVQHKHQHILHKARNTIHHSHQVKTTRLEIKTNMLLALTGYIRSCVNVQLDCAIYLQTFKSLNLSTAVCQKMKTPGCVNL